MLRHRERSCQANRAKAHSARLTPNDLWRGAPVILRENTISAGFCSANL
jgi:hypothetical protein